MTAEHLTTETVFVDFGYRGKCEKCIHWSELVARSLNGGPLEALCEATGTNAGKYTTGKDSCEKFSHV